jgi:hypothetical protein
MSLDRGGTEWSAPRPLADPYEPTREAAMAGVRAKSWRRE